MATARSATRPMLQYSVQFVTKWVQAQSHGYRKLPVQLPHDAEESRPGILWHNGFPCVTVPTERTPYPAARTTGHTAALFAAARRTLGTCPLHLGKNWRRRPSSRSAKEKGGTEIPPDDESVKPPR